MDRGESLVSRLIITVVIIMASQWDDQQYFRLNFSGGNGTGASAYAVMDTNTSAHRQL